MLRRVVEVALLAALLLMLLACGGGTQPTTPAPAPTTPAVKPTVSREEFTKSVLGKTPDEVIKAVGKPDSTDDFDASAPVWYYRERTLNPVTEKKDFQAQVIFKGGKVDHVNY